MSEQNPYDDKLADSDFEHEEVQLEQLLLRAAQYKLDELMGEVEWRSLQMDSFYGPKVPPGFAWVVYCKEAKQAGKKY